LSVRIPVSTYRLQFNSRFTFRDASAVAEYLHALGISDCYASSYLKAVPGSPHGYDVADPTQLNPEIGTENDYWRWIDELSSRGMGHILDLVPNHMGIAKSANPWWTDVLENGASSRFAKFFDIEWHPVKDELASKVLLPILGDQYGAVLEHQQLKLAYRAGGFVIIYFDDVLPIAPDTFGDILGLKLDAWLEENPARQEAADELRSIISASSHLPLRETSEAEQIAVRAREKEIIKRRLAALVDRSEEAARLIDATVAIFNGTIGEPRSFDLLDRLLNRQSYRLAHWRVASEEINYRRFFDVNQLAALRMEDPQVFDQVHRFAFELVKRGAATGLRIDHVDGLYAPGDYLRRLQHRAGGANGASLYIVVEKILKADERLPNWPVHGTTGYEFAAVVNNLFVDSRNERALDDIYMRFVRERRERPTFADLAYRSKKLILHETMSGDINSLGHQLNQFSEGNRHFRDFTLYSLISTLKEIIANFSVYRTYVVADRPVEDHDRRYIVEAVRNAKRRAAAVESVVFDFVQKLLLKQTSISSAEACEERARFIGKFQQMTSPVAAKGIEDSALYTYNRLLSLNEVGADPTRFGMTPEAVHAWMIERQRRWPASLSATSTHDTKRGEDVRARLNVLSEVPGAWKASVARWRQANRRFKTEINGEAAPDRNEEYLIYQTLVGMWPFTTSSAIIAQVRTRLLAFATKALREAKVHTSWMSPDEDYEGAVAYFIEKMLDRTRPNPFFQSFLPFQARVAELGIYNSLSQLLIKIAAPGVPDFYQGTELWDLNLVDPDNRRAVDYDVRRRWLNEPPCVGRLLEHRADGRIKLFAIQRALTARRDLREVFELGDYVPLAASGVRRDCLFAFAREHAGRRVIACVPRLVATLVPDASAPPIGPGVWNDTTIDLPDSAASAREYRDVFTGEAIGVCNGSLGAAAIFKQLPFALLVGAG
jgi:(1->4)-alpha-D-glucan 1-alpha-D-glucosylmutase